MRAAAIVEVPANADFVIEGHVDPREPLHDEGQLWPDAATAMRGASAAQKGSRKRGLEMQ